METTNPKQEIPEFIPFSAVKGTRKYADADLNGKREYFKAWAKANLGIAGDDKALKKEVIDAADIIREGEKMGSTIWETLGDVGLQAALGIGGMAAGTALAPGPGTVAGGAAGGAAGSVAVQSRRMERGEQFQPSIAEGLTDTALGMIPGGEVGGTGIKAVGKAALKAFPKFAGIGAVGAAARDYETRGEVRPVQALKEGAKLGLGAGLLEGGVEGLSQLFRGIKLAGLTDEQFTAYLDKNKNLVENDKLTSAQISRRKAINDEKLAASAADAKAKEALEVEKAQLESAAELAAAMDELRAEAKKRGLNLAAGAEDGAANGTIKASDGRTYVQDKDGNLVEVSKLLTQRAKDSAETLATIPDVIEGTLEPTPLAPRLTEEQALAGLGDIINPGDSAPTFVDQAIAGNFLKEQDGALTKLGFVGPDEGVGNANKAFRTFEEANRPKTAADSADVFEPGIVAKADQAAAGKASPNSVATPNLAADDALASDVAAGYTITKDPETGLHYLEDPEGNLVDEFKTREEAQEYANKLQAGEEAPLPDAPPAPDAEPVPPANFNDIPPADVSAPNTSFEEYPRVDAPKIKGTEGKEAKTVPLTPEGPALTLRQLDRVNKRLRAIDKELEVLSNKGIKGRTGAGKAEYNLAKRRAEMVPLLEERLQLQADMGNKQAEQALLEWNARKAGGTGQGNMGHLDEEQAAMREALDMVNRGGSGKGNTMKLTRAEKRKLSLANQDNPKAAGEIRNLMQNGVKVDYSTDLDALRESVNQVRRENGLSEFEDIWDATAYLEKAAAARRNGEFDAPLPPVIGEPPKAPARPKTPKEVRAERMAAVEGGTGESPALPKAQTETEAPIKQADAKPALSQPTKKDLTSSDRFVGEDYAGPANSIVIQVRGLDTEPLGGGALLSVPFNGDLAEAGKSISKLMSQVRNEVPSASMRETLIKATDANGRATHHFIYDPINGSVKATTQAELEAMRAGLKDNSRSAATEAVAKGALPKPIASLDDDNPGFLGFNKIEATEAWARQNGIKPNGSLPSAGEPLLGGTIGYFATEKREGETDEQFEQRRRENAALGMAAGLALSTAMRSRLAQRLGAIQVGTELGATPVKQLSKKEAQEYRKQLLNEVSAANKVALESAAGTVNEGKSAAVQAAIKAGPDAKFDPIAEAKKIDEANLAARQGAQKTPVQKFGETLNYFQRKFVTKNEFVYRMKRYAEEVTGKKFEASLDPEIITKTRAANSESIANQHINQEGGIADFATKMVPAEAKRLGMDVGTYSSLLEKYLISKQALNRYMAGATEAEIGGGFTKDVAANFVAKLDNDFGAMGKRVNDYYRELLDIAADRGLINKDLAEYLKVTYPDYVPFNRIFDGDEIAEGLAGFKMKGGKADASVASQNVVQRFNGSEREIESPLEGMFGRAYKTFELAGRNDAAKSWASLGSKEWLGEASGIKPLYKIGADGAPLKAEGGFVPLQDGNYMMIDAAGNAVKDADGQAVIVGRNRVTQTNNGNWVGDGRVIKDEAAVAKAKHTFSYLVNGERLDVEAPQAMVEAAKSMGVPPLGLFAKILRYPITVGRAGFTGLNPVFAVKNVPRDVGQAVMNTENFRDIPKLFAEEGKGGWYAKRLFGSFGEAMKSALKGQDSEYLKIMGQFGGRYNLTDALRPSNAQRLAEGRSTFARLTGAKVTVGDKVEHAFRKVEDFISTTETMTRLGIFKAEVEKLAEEPLKKGLIFKTDKGVFGGDEATIANIFSKAAYEAQERTANYLNRGEWGTALNGVFMYLNAGIQATRANVKAFRANPTAYALKALIGGGFGLAAATYYNLSDPARAEAYKNLTEDDRSRNLILLDPLGRKDEEGNYYALRIPLPQGVSNLMQGPRRVIEHFYGVGQEMNKPELFVKVGKDLLGDAFGFATPFEPDTNKILSTVVPQAFRPALEVNSTINRNFFTGQMVVPRYLQNVPAEDQYTAKTSETMKQLGSILGVSPIKLEYLARGYTGSLASTGLFIADTALNGAKGQAPSSYGPATDLRKAVFSARGGQQLNDFYDNFAQSEQAYTGFKTALERGDKERAMEIRDDHKVELGLYEPLRRLNAKMGEVYSAIRTIENRQDIPAEVRKERVTQLRDVLTQLATKGNEIRNQAHKAARETDE